MGESKEDLVESYDLKLNNIEYTIDIFKSADRIRETGYTVLYFDRANTIWWLIIDIDHKDLIHLKRDIKLQEILSI